MASHVRTHKRSCSSWQQVKLLPPGLGCGALECGGNTPEQLSATATAGPRAAQPARCYRALKRGTTPMWLAGLLRGSNTSRCCARAGAAAQVLQDRQNSLCLLLAGESPALQPHTSPVCSQDPAKGASTAKSRAAGGQLSRDARPPETPSSELSEGGLSKQGQALPPPAGSRTRGAALCFCSCEGTSGKLA